MDAFTRLLGKMVEEVKAGAALYHFEDDGIEYTLIRNGVAIGGVSHEYAEANPAMKEAIETCFNDGTLKN